MMNLINQIKDLEMSKLKMEIDSKNMEDYHSAINNLINIYINLIDKKMMKKIMLVQEAKYVFIKINTY